MTARKRTSSGHQRVANPKTYARWVKFAEAYVRTGIDETAALEAGFAPSTAATKAQRIRAHPEVQKLIVELSAKARNSAIADATARKEFWTRVMLDDREQMKDRLRASDLLGRADGDFVSKVEHSGAVDTGAAVINLSVTRQGNK